METKWRIREDEDTEIILTDALEIHIIELSKTKREYEPNKENRKVQWVMFLNNPNTEEVEKIMEENKEIKEAVVEVHKMSKDEKIRKLAELREKAIMDEKEIYSTGYNKGKREIAKILKKKGMSKEEISEITKLTIKELEEI
jgi:predicted transposase/invertase (TIGR01784 family)